MMKVQNRKAIRQLSIKSFAANKLRNGIAAVAIGLTAILFTTLFTLGMGAAENIQQSSLRQSGGGGHAVLKYITDEEYDIFEKSPFKEKIGYRRVLADSVNNPELLKRRGEFYCMNDEGYNIYYCAPETGKIPEAENEIIMDTKALKLLGIPQELGAKVTLDLTVHGKQVTREFILCGWWEPDPIFPVSYLITSEAYAQAHREELPYTYDEDYSMTGTIVADLIFSNTLDLEGKLEALLQASGYQTKDQDAPNYIGSNVNWAYLSTNFSFDFQTVLGLLAAAALIILTGYLIIYNIFQISVLRDIRFYGLLKTIGATKRQIRQIIRYQALVLSALGIPAGLLIGFWMGKGLLPLILQNLFNGMGVGSVRLTANPVIFIISALFALVTVFISAYRPGRIASEVSPVEAVRYTDQVGKQRKKGKRSTDGGKLHRMALSNLGRNKSRTVLVILSLSLSLVLLNTVFTVASGFDMDKFLGRFVDTDYLIAEASYFNYQFRGPENSLTESMVSAVQDQPGFQEGGRIYSNNRDAEFFTVEDPQATDPVANGTDEFGHFMCAFYGLDDLPLSRLTVLEGELDLEKLKTGDYILEGIVMNDHDEPYWSTSHFEIGDTVTLHNYKGESDNRGENEYTTHTYTVMAKVKINYFTNSDGSSRMYNFYIPSEEYLDLVSEAGLMSYVYNVADEEEAAMEQFLASYTETVEPTMHYSSKLSRVKEFESTRNMIYLLGGVLTFIIGLIGLLNFVNAVLTSIISRRREFAALEAIGMTGKQLKGMLTLEGLYYACITAAGSLVLSIALSLGFIQNMGSGIWFFQYHFILWPILAVIPFMIIIAAVIPPISMHFSNRQSVVERLRETD